MNYCKYLVSLFWFSIVAELRVDVMFGVVMMTIETLEHEML